MKDLIIMKSGYFFWPSKQFNGNPFLNDFQSFHFMELTLSSFLIAKII